MFPYITEVKSPVLPFLWYAPAYAGAPDHPTDGGVGYHIQCLCLSVFL